MKIKKATIKDFDEVLNLKFASKIEERKFNKKLMPVNKAKRYYKEYLKNDLTNRWRAIFVFIKNKEIVGIVVGKIFKTLKVTGYERCGFISNVYVKKEYRRKGIAKKLIKEIIGWFKKKGATKISLELYKDNIAAIKLYHKFGFKDYTIKMKKKI